MTILQPRSNMVDLSSHPSNPRLPHLYPPKQAKQNTEHNTENKASSPHQWRSSTSNQPALSPLNMSTSISDDDDSFEHTLLVIREVTVYKIPPRSTSGGYKCGEWLQSDRIWCGRLRLVSCHDRCEIRLEDPSSGDLFAACFVLPGQREQAVEPALDSSRYFVIRIEDGKGKHAFVGLGFGERNEAFDFNVALSDHDKYVKRGAEKEEGGEESGENRVDVHPAVNHRLKEGETIRINVKHKTASGAGVVSGAGLSSGLSGPGKPKTLGLAPPPAGTGKIRSALPPPPNDPVAARLNSSLKGSKDNAIRHTDPLSDFSQLEHNLPSTVGSGSTKSNAAGWAAF